MYLVVVIANIDLQIHRLKQTCIRTITNVPGHLAFGIYCTVLNGALLYRQ